MPVDMRLDWYGIESCVESFFATLKKELIFRKKYARIKEKRRSIYVFLQSRTISMPESLMHMVDILLSYFFNQSNFALQVDAHTYT